MFFSVVTDKELSCTNIIIKSQGKEGGSMEQNRTIALKIINREIRAYQKKLIEQLELKAESELNNGNIKLKDDDYENNISKYEIILANLATIKSAIKKNRKRVKIYCTKNGYLYSEIGKIQREMSYAGHDIYF